MKSQKLYSTKQVWKIILSIAALVIIGLSLWYTNYLASKIQNKERLDVKRWSETVKKQAQLVNLTNQTFEQLKAEEKDNIQDWTKAMNEIAIRVFDDYTFVSYFLTKNHNVPTITEIVTFKGSEVSRSFEARNLDIKKDSSITEKEFQNTLKELAMKWDKLNPFIEIKNTSNQSQLFHYGNSKLFTQLKEKSDSLINSFENELIMNSASIPILYIDSASREIKRTINIDSQRIKDSSSIEKTIKEMGKENEKIKVAFGNGVTGFIYYSESSLLKQLRYYPFIQIIIIFLFLLVSYFLFSTFRKAEQNQVWAGMAKETAHQLGTPLSSLMAWLEIIKSDGVPESSITEMNKDIDRLNTITDRFSKIGSKVKTTDNNIYNSVLLSTDYLKSRVSQNVKLSVTGDKIAIAKINTSLFEWVIENITKNAIDAIHGEKGKVTYLIQDQSNKVILDIADTGKGIPSSNFKSIFNPGYSTKERGWGLGLSLVKRIVEEQLGGKIYVLNSKIDHGTTFRIVLKK